MRRFFICTIFLGIILQLTGCWIPWPANQHSEYSHYIGKTVETTTDIFLQKPNFFMGTIGFSRKVVKRNRYMTIPAGSVLKIIGITTTVNDAGQHNGFKCHYDADGKPITFHYGISSIINGKWVVAGHFKLLD